MLSAPAAAIQSRSMSFIQNIWFHTTNQSSSLTVILLFGFFLFWYCSACEQLIEALTHQLCEMEKVTLQNMKGMTLLVPEPVHFLLPEPKGLVTVVYPVGVPDSQLVAQRKVSVLTCAQSSR